MASNTRGSGSVYRGRTFDQGCSSDLQSGSERSSGFSFLRLWPCPYPFTAPVEAEGGANEGIDVGGAANTIAVPSPPRSPLSRFPPGEKEQLKKPYPGCSP